MIDHRMEYIEDCEASWDGDNSIEHQQPKSTIDGE